MNLISRETFQSMPDTNKLDVLFDVTVELHICSCEMRDKLKALEEKVDKRKKIDTSIAATAGFIAGYISVLVGKFLK